MADRQEQTAKNRAIVQQWLTGWIRRQSPGRRVDCRVCAQPIAAGAPAFRYIAGFWNNQPRERYLCRRCGLEAILAIVETAVGVAIGVQRAPLVQALRDIRHTCDDEEVCFFCGYEACHPPGCPWNPITVLLDELELAECGEVLP